MSDTWSVWRRPGAWPYRYGWAAVKRSRDVRTVEAGTAMTRRGAEAAALRVAARAEAVETLLWERGA